MTAADSDVFKGRHFDQQVIVLCVRWYLSYKFEIYIRNNREFIPNFGERYRNGEIISTALVESTINHVV